MIFVRLGDNGLTAAFTDYRIHIPVAVAVPGINNGGAFIDGRPVADLTPAAVDTIAFLALLLATKVTSLILVGGRKLRCYRNLSLKPIM